MIKITGLYALRSEKPFDFSHSILETSHHQFHFCQDGHNQPRKWEGIVTDADLFNALLEKHLIKEVSPNASLNHESPKDA